MSPIKANKRPYKDTLVKQIKLMAKDLYENAEKFVGDKEFMTGFDIWMHFPTGEYDGAPTIEVNAEYVPDNYRLAFEPDTEEAEEELKKGLKK